MLQHIETICFRKVSSDKTVASSKNNLQDIRAEVFRKRKYCTLKKTEYDSLKTLIIAYINELIIFIKKVLVKCFGQNNDLE